MSEYIVSVSDEEAELFIARFGIGGTQMFGHRLVGEIVRCRDCEYLVAHGAGCSYWDFCDVYDTNGFCAWGERRDV